MEECNFCNKEKKNDDCKYENRMKDKSKSSLLALELFNYYMTKYCYVNKKKTKMQFVKSKYYDAFLKTSSYLISLNIINYYDYIDAMNKLKIPLDKWYLDTTYNKFIKHHNNSMKTMKEIVKKHNEFIKKWSIKNNIDADKYWEKCSSNEIINNIKLKKIHPCILIVSDKANKFLTSLNNEELVNILYDELELEKYTKLINKDIMEKYKNV